MKTNNYHKPTTAMLHGHLIVLVATSNINFTSIDGVVLESTIKNIRKNHLTPYNISRRRDMLNLFIYLGCLAAQVAVSRVTCPVDG